LNAPALLAVIEAGGYPNLQQVYREAGYEPVVVNSVRKALAILKKQVPRVVVAEFNYQSDFRDRTSSLESLLAVVQRAGGVRVIVFYDSEMGHQLDRLHERFPIFERVAFPVSVEAMRERLAPVAVQATASGS